MKFTVFSTTHLVFHPPNWVSHFICKSSLPVQAVLSSESRRQHAIAERRFATTKTPDRNVFDPTEQRARNGVDSHRTMRQGAGKGLERTLRTMFRCQDAPLHDFCRRRAADVVGVAVLGAPT